MADFPTAMVAPIETTSGVYLDAANPRPEHVPGPYDLGYALARIARFGGHGRATCSVAMHSIQVAALLRHRGADDRVVLAGLLHDAAEAFVGDVPSPVKRIIGNGYRKIEKRIAWAIAAAYGLDPGALDREDVHQADLAALAIEAARELPSAGAGWGLRDPHTVLLPNDVLADTLTAMGIDPVVLREGCRFEGPEMQDYAQAWGAAVLHLATITPESTIGPQCPVEDNIGPVAYRCLGITGHRDDCHFAHELYRESSLDQAVEGPTA
jgi:hypothetical protein